MDDPKIKNKKHIAGVASQVPASTVERRRSLHGQWTSRFGFVLAVASAAVVLGNLRRFPCIAGAYGGGASVLVYLLSAFLAYRAWRASARYLAVAPAVLLAAFVLVAPVAILLNTLGLL
jgi:hypothetical protein